MPGIQKDSINPHFGNSYVSLDRVLDIVLPVLHARRILLLQLPANIDGRPALTTSFIHIDEKGIHTSVESTTPLVLDKETPQAFGSALTYTKRYALLSSLGLTADEDDDAEEATSEGGYTVKDTKAVRAAF